MSGRTARRGVAPFPRGFLFGVATADHQCEAYDPAFPDSFDLWERSRGIQLRERATDFWTRYREDIDLAKGLGCNAFRMSVSWARVEPRPGEFDDANIAHYRAVVEALLAAGMTPVLTLMHNVWPQHVQDDGGLLAPDFPDRFERYARVVAERIGDGVAYWVSINEPTQLVFGYIKPWWQATYAMPPGMPPTATEDDQMDAVGKVIPTLFHAHTRARAAIRALHANAKVGTNPLLLGLPLWMQRIADARAERAREETFRSQDRHFVRRSIPFFDSFARFVGVATTALNGNWWHLGMAGKLPAFLCPPECVGQQDYVGLDYYWGIPSFRLDRVEHLLDAAQQKYAQAPVWPRVLYDMLKRYAAMFPGQEVLIIENGCVTTADGIPRASYLERHLRQVERALRAGVNVKGYLVWSITSNREWGLRFDANSDFGLYYVDLDRDHELKRVETPAAAAYRSLIRSRRPTD